MKKGLNSTNCGKNQKFVDIHSNANEAIKYLGEAGVKVLRDSTQTIAGSINLIGRDDQSGARYNGGPRKDLKTLKLIVNYIAYILGFTKVVFWQIVASASMPITAPIRILSLNSLSAKGIPSS